MVWAFIGNLAVEAHTAIVATASNITIMAIPFWGFGLPVSWIKSVQSIIESEPTSHALLLLSMDWTAPNPNAMHGGIRYTMGVVVFIASRV
ncbi:MAG: hypothetical protein NXY59_02070 [Aigarchaeota archaeon]|nr:hypothetical protein [Candidatus Pelearchaeum maunauluense]